MALALCVLTVLSRQFGAEPSPFRPYQHRAWYLLYFARYTEWPKEALGNGDAPFVFGILGKDPFGKDIEIIRDKTIKGRKITVKHFAKVQEVSGCHLLFIASSEAAQLPKILKALEKSSILTIAEVESFVQQSVMINLQGEQDKTASRETVTFVINRAAAEKANLKLDAELLKLAKRVTS